MLRRLEKTFEISKPQGLFYTKGITKDAPIAIKVVLDEIKGATEKELVFFKECALKMEIGLNSEAFKTRVTNPPFILQHTNGLSYKTIYELISSGRTELDQKIDHEANIRIEVYYNRWSRTVGYTYPNTVWQWINRKYMGTLNSKETMYSCCNNLLHEYAHKCGFTHESRGYTRRNIPYFYGDSLELILRNNLI